MRVNRRQAQFEHDAGRYFDDLYRFAYWLARDRWRAEDLVQETLARAWRNWSALRDAGALKAWLFTILHREFARSVARVEPTEELDGDGAWEPALDADPARGIDLRTALRGLPDASREALLLQVLGGFSCAEIAAMLESSEGAVMTRLTRARQVLRRSLGTDVVKEFRQL
jgi:RNA polymerase sigma-70 factor (ECF subfamily)